MASIRKREWTHNGVKRSAWVVDYKDQTGKRHIKTFDKKKDADEHRKQVEKEVDGGIHVHDRESTTFNNVVDEWEREQQRRTARGEITRYTCHVSIKRVRDVLCPVFGQQLVSKITADQIQRQFDEQLIPRFAATTLDTLKGHLSEVLQYATKLKVSRRNVMRDQRIKTPRRNKRAAIPSRADLIKLLEVSRVFTPRHSPHSVRANRQVFVALGIFGGLRRGEMLGLRWEDIDPAAGVIHVRRNLARIDGLKAPKTAAGVRDVPLSNPIYDALERAAIVQDRHIAARQSSHARVQNQPAINARFFRRTGLGLRGDAPILSGRTGPILINKVGQPLRDIDGRIWLELMEAAGLTKEDGSPKFGLHALRHAAVSLFLAEGLPALNLKTMIGHANVSTTYDVYGHLFPEDRRVREAADRVAMSIAGALGATRTQQGPASS